MTQRAVVFVGSPDAGKSNYLFRLWLALRDGKHRRLVPDGTPTDIAYLNAGAAEQLLGEYAQRTQGEVNERPVLPLKADGMPVALVAPDRPGEDWDKLYTDRRWPAGWLDLLSPDTTYLVFVSTLTAVQAPDWFKNQAMRGPKANFRKVQDASSAAPPAQLVVVDWIQMILAAHRKVARWNTSRPLPRIGIVLTAWDIIAKGEGKLTPLEFLKREHRLLYDYVSNSGRVADIRVFASSLYGNDLNDPTFKAELANGANPPQTLGYVVTQSSAAQIQDLALPVTWALGLD